jgi:cytochrome c-type biogenesis protein CcmE
MSKNNKNKSRRLYQIIMAIIAISMIISMIALALRY